MCVRHFPTTRCLRKVVLGSIYLNAHRAFQTADLCSGRSTFQSDLVISSGNMFCIPAYILNSSYKSPVHIYTAIYTCRDAVRLPVT